MGTPIYISLLVAAIAAVVALSVGWFARVTARDIAALTAQQKRRDVRIKALGDYVELLMTAAAATQAYVWYADPEFVRNRDVTQEDWTNARELFQPAYEAYSKVKYLGTTLADESLRETYDRLVADLRTVIFAKGSVKDAWHAIVKAEDQPDSIAQAITAANNLYKAALNSYPTEVPNSLTARFKKEEKTKALPAQSARPLPPIDP
jgi:hypothetical protein